MADTVTNALRVNEYEEFAKINSDDAPKFYIQRIHSYVVPAWCSTINIQLDTMHIYIILGMIWRILLCNELILYSNNVAGKKFGALGL